jgi:hypothetical protein
MSDAWGKVCDAREFTLVVMTRLRAEQTGAVPEASWITCPLLGVIAPDDETKGTAMWFKSTHDLKEFIGSMAPREIKFECGKGEDVDDLEAQVRSTLH